MGVHTNRLSVIGAVLAAGGLLGTSAAHAATVVRDTWQDASRTDPAAPTYSENGVDADADGDIESAWYISGTGATLTPSTGQLLITPPAGGSASISNYFTPEASPVTLSAAGQSMTVTWRFTTGNVAATSTGQDFRFAVVDSPSALRVSADGTTPGAGAYTGYAIFGNMAETFGNSNPFQLRERGTTNGALLSAGGEWISFSPNVNDGTSTNSGYQDNTQYTLTWTFTRNPSDGLDITATMSGGTLLDNGTGLSVSVTDPSPNTFTFDMFHFRPSTGANTTSDTFTTTLFQVEYVPEPASLGLLAAGGLLLAGRRRRA
jgi:hypothetical protein